jgi:hypothetical protein
VRELERLSLAVALVVLALTRGDTPVALAIMAASAVVARWHGCSWVTYGRWLLVPLPFLAMTTLAGWWGRGMFAAPSPAALMAVAGQFDWAHDPLLRQALRAEACTAAVGIAVLTVSLPVSAAAARRIGVPSVAVEILVLALRVVQSAGRSLRARRRAAPLRFATTGASSRMRTSVGLAATMAMVTQQRALRMDSMMSVRGAPNWPALAALVPPGRPVVLMSIAGALLVGWRVLP